MVKRESLTADTEVDGGSTAATPTTPTVGDAGASLPAGGGVAEAAATLLTLEELTQRVGMSVRNVRFYTTKGLVPPPIRRGRSGYYSPDHVARLELVKDLQGHGFTLSAIEKYLAAIPPDASPEDIALHRTMLAPWQADTTQEMTRAELERRAGRELSDADLDTLAALGVAMRTKRGRYEVSTTQLTVGLGLVDLGFPTEAAVAAADVYTAHGRQLAKELNDLFRTMVWPAYKEAGASAEAIREMVERLKPLSIASLVAAYEAAMDETRRERIAARARSDRPS
ncbi:MerR family transcriptional regulator [Nocardioides fonticola]|uniref:MerR family transcriptional regulator n=1 Tax=Nocardioides fonticola TaxID=450363 RepID=A0ABP7XPQ1_9ACTN